MSKRRRIDDPETVPSSASQPTAETTGVQLVEPKLREIPKLVLVDMQKDDPHSVIQAMNLLVDKTLDSDQGKLFQAVAVPKILDAMQKWQHHEGLQREACYCIRRICKHDSDLSELMASLGGLEALVNAMIVFPTSVRIHEYALGAIRYVAAEDSPGLVRFMKGLKGIDLTLRAMESFQDNAGVQRACCRLFCSLACGPVSKKALAEAGVISAVATCMEENWENMSVMKAAGEFMDIMSP